jgi:hypothetical protein
MIEAISDLRFPKNFSYVFGGLKPLSIKYIESIFEMKGFKNIDKKSKLLTSNRYSGCTHACTSRNSR